jgi:hypothetical protein
MTQLEALIQNSKERLEASLTADVHFGGQTYTLATSKEEGTRCDFDPRQLAN